ncbi:Hint domain-containing protein [uncultured Roseobacter sp.]|uniref:Hint domain-containing protein n=1 Tax=uncultured Roseobacter sp. TaxID=114847 RepID=UPI0026069300|nr:Hint domain-containing protein [uncultured Roseobacter sp.]
MTHAPICQTVHAFAAADLFVRSGANEGDALHTSDTLSLGDLYRLKPHAQLQQLAFRGDDAGASSISTPSAPGQPGVRLTPDAILTLMSQKAPAAEVVVLTDGAGTVYALPLSPLQSRVDYQLVGIEREAAAERLAQAACVSFTRGTRITLASGKQVPVEQLTPGDAVLTRDDGVQPLRWIGHSTVRATGALAPVRLRQGALNNARDLVVSPGHRLFIHQRSDGLALGRRDLTVKAVQLVNGTTVTRARGGFVDYFQLLFDRHQIIYAEGIAVETMFVDARTATLLPADLAAGATTADDRRLARLDVPADRLDRPDATDVLRRASLR